MIKMFKEFEYRYSLWDVFQDFLFISAACISNSVDFVRRNKREAEYLRIIKKYKKEDLDRFAKLFAELIMTLHENVGDILGELFMEMELGSKWKGQFFTPYNLSLLIAGLSIGNSLDEIKENGCVTFNEPTCGSGGMIIAFAEAMKENKYNPQKELKVIAQDLDVKCVWMAYIQLSLLGIPAAVYHANTLSLEFYDVWYTPFYILGNWNYRGKAL